MASLLLVFVAATVWPVTDASARSTNSEELERELHDTQRRESDVENDLDEVQTRIERAEVELAQLTVDLEEARSRLAAAEGQVALAEAALRDAEDERDRARAAHERAERLLTAADERLRDEERQLETQVVEAFKHGTAGATRGAMLLEILRRADDPNEFSRSVKQLQIVMDTQDATVKRVFELRDERRDLADDAARARSRASQAASDAQETLEHLERLREEAAELTRGIESDEDRQRELLASLQQSEDETTQLLERVGERAETLRTELREVRAEEAARNRAQSADGGGGPPLDGAPCPVVGAVAGRDFQNDWGFPRSGGRTHKGNDIFAARGAAVVAVDAGQVIRTNPAHSPTGLGGVTVTYRTSDGSEWYNAHLNAIAEGIAPGVRVEQGQVIGEVGNSGNARTTPPHLHIGRRHGGVAVNPWPTIAPLCR